MSFKAGQEVAVLSTRGDVERITTVSKVVRKTIHVNGETTLFDAAGRAKGNGMPRRKIRPVTGEHIDALARRESWRTVDLALGTNAGAEEQSAARALVSSDLLGKVADLLAPIARAVKEENALNHCRRAARAAERRGLDITYVDTNNPGTSAGKVRAAVAASVVLRPEDREALTGLADALDSLARARNGA